MARILNVDDDEVTRLRLGQILQDDGHEVTYAGNGGVALGVFRIGRFDAVITDLAMPERNSLRLILDLREQDRSLPLIAMSGSNADQLQWRARIGRMADPGSPPGSTVVVGSAVSRRGPRPTPPSDPLPGPPWRCGRRTA
jgi:CheY-like chemotaxis protein